MTLSKNPEYSYFGCTKTSIVSYLPLLIWPYFGDKHPIKHVGEWSMT